MFRFFVLLACLVSPVFAQTKTGLSAEKSAAEPRQRKDAAAPADSTARLPVKRVVLYKNGIGYFEHTARVHGNQDLAIDFTTGQLNDVLKSLTVVDLGQGRIGSVRYNSIAPLDERLRSLRLPFGETIDQAEFLQALRGARVEVRSGSSSATGRLLSVEKVHRQNPKGDMAQDVTVFAVVTDSGEMHNFELGSSTTVRLADRELTDEVGRYLNLVGSSRARDLRRMTISAVGAGDRDVFVSYISEVPVWKSTYRILLPTKPDEKPLLQGWAIVDNTVGEDWKDVELSLIAGAPQSFIQNISQPYYTRRPTVELSQAYMLTPQTHEEAMETASAAGVPGGVTESVQVEAAAAPVAAGSGGGVGGGVFRVGGGVANGRLNVAQLSTLNAGLMNQAAQNAAQVGAREAGDYFEYRLKEKTSIGKNQSALVPIVSARVEAEKVSLWNEQDQQTLRALWLKNSSELTIDAGTFNVLDADTFAGEGLLDTMHAGERRLLSYAADPALHVKMDAHGGQQPVSRLWISKGIMMLGHEQRDARTYTAHNVDQSPRTLVIEHPAREGWKLTDGSPKPAETSASYLRFDLPVKAGATEKLEIEETHLDYVQYQLSNIDDDQVALLVKTGSLTPAAERALHRVLDQKNVVQGVQSQIDARKKEIDSIGKDQARVRENMKALKGSAEEKALVQRYARQLDQQEDRLGTLQKEIADLQVKHDQAQSDLDRLIESISLNEDRSVTQGS